MPIPLIEFDQVAKSYARAFGWQRTTIFSGISLNVSEAEIVGLSGPSGCGKSTLLKMFFRLTGWDQGQIRYRGRDITKLGLAARRRVHREVQIVFQDPRNAFNPSWRIRRSLAEPLRLFRIGDFGDISVIFEKMGLLGLEEGLLDRYPHQLSGGQLQRLALLRCLVVCPRCLLLDEASSMLDLSVQAQMMALIKQLQSDEAVSVLLVSHDLDLIKAMSQRSYRFEGGRLDQIS